MQSYRRLRVRHTTVYQYDRPICGSVHRVHLRPVDDFRQKLRSHSLWLTPFAVAAEHLDDFGNWTSRFEVRSPYTQLSIATESIVDVLDVDPFDFIRFTIPLSHPLHWSECEKRMLAPFFAPAVPPTAQSHELHEYAMHFVRRNNGNLLETLFDVNLTLFREFSYAPGSTHIGTSPHEVFRSRRGVCQDFANLFLCLARLLNLPARYVYGYLFTGNNGGRRACSDATHAWIEVFIPGAGWQGFDPTLGVLPRLDHIRVGVGRDHRDCTPTAGTLFTPASEAMFVDVEMEDLSTPVRPFRSGVPLGKTA